MAYVYRHIRLDKNQPFYIGIGISDKDFDRANETYNRNEIWKRIASKTKIEVEILLSGLTIDQAKEKEKEFIALYGRINNLTGCLSNMTDGGDCNSFKGRRHKPETIKKMRASSYKIKKVICKETGNSWVSVRAAAEELGINYTTLRSWLNGSRKNLSTLCHG
jgi:hypothetical protein